MARFPKYLTYYFGLNSYLIVHQDHLYTGWMTQKHRDLVRDFRNGVSQGTVHAPWKDEVWDRDHPEENAVSGDGGGGSVEQEDNDDPARNIMSRIGTRTSRDNRKDRYVPQFHAKCFL